MDNNCVVIDVNEIYTVRALHETLKKQLNLPDFYGMNWSAFWDAITGLIELPEKIVFSGWSNMKSFIPEDAAKLKDIMEQFNARYPQWKCNVEYR